MFMRYISHEIRTPLNSVVMGLKLVEEGLEDGSMGRDETLKSVYEVKVAVDVALAVLNDLLMLDKVKQGLLVLELTNQEPFVILRKTVNCFNIQVDNPLLLYIPYLPKSSLISGSSSWGHIGNSL